MVQAFEDSLHLPTNTAKKIVYYTLAASKVADCKFFPALAIVGPSGSGKSSIQRGAMSMDSSARWIACMGVSAVSVRDELGEAKDKLCILEEFDQVADLRAASGFVQARCDVNTANVMVKRQMVQNGPYIPTVVNLYGATILHVRDPLHDPALVSRSLTVYTRHLDGDFSDPIIFPGWYQHALGEIDWDVAITGFRGGRVFDTWERLLQVAAGLHDEEWLEWARAQIQLLQIRLQEAAVYDLRQLILGRIIQTLTWREETPGADVWDRIGIDVAIGQPIRDTLLPQATPWQIADTIKGMEFQTQKRGGKVWLLPSAASLLLACEAAGYRDDLWIEELRKR